ncbi:MAG: Tat pathway signal protein [Sphingomonas bacterium]|nr:Tat pathway signal protein [Sphingomonas bacterium]
MVGGAAVTTLAVAGGGLAYRRSTDLSSFREVTTRLRAALKAEPRLPELVRYATLAANSHNTQAWRFRLGHGGIDIEPDFSRRTPVVDPDDHHLWASLGCAVENLMIAASATNRPLQLIATDGRLQTRFGGPAHPHATLADAIPRRQSTRSQFDGRSVPVATLNSLADAVRVPGVDVVLLTEKREIAQLTDLVVARSHHQVHDPVYLRELRHWLRFSPADALRPGDGLFSAMTGNPVMPGWIGTKMFDLFFDPEAEDDKMARQMASSSGIAIFVGERVDPNHWVLAGQACQRFALQATALGMRCSFVNQPVEVPPLRAGVARIAGQVGKRPDLVMRFGYGPAMPYSTRQPVADVIA